ncbi:MAG: hypothetical protein DBY32_04600 [Phascolarctobacterium sp.]|nr:MAG: hypothetical protein DBY32_04600 [Phascolarctobacterium sp.]
MVNSELLKQEIKDSGLKIAKIAEIVGMSHNAFSGKMGNVRPFTILEAKAICNTLNITDPARIVAIFFA